MLTADREKSKSPKCAKVRFLLATLTYALLSIHACAPVQIYARVTVRVRAGKKWEMLQ